jgi:hypothetical protein
MLVVGEYFSFLEKYPPHIHSVNTAIYGKIEIGQHPIPLFG